MTTGSLLRWLFAIVFLGAALPAAAQTDPEAPAPLFASAPLSDGYLAQHRGGFLLPNGMEVSLAVTMLTSVNGERVLETSFRIDGTTMAFDAQGTGAPKTETSNGTITTTAALPHLVVEHLVGNHVGSLIANSGDNRVIDHDVSVDLTLDNVQPLSIGSAIFRVQSISTDALGLRASGG